MPTKTKRTTRLYPWERWFSQKSFRIIRGKHFDCQVHGMAQQIRNAASYYGVGVSISVEAETVIVKVRRRD